MLKTTKGLNLKAKIYRKVDDEWKPVATVGELIESYYDCKELKKENKVLKKDNRNLKKELRRIENEER